MRKRFFIALLATLGILGITAGAVAAAPQQAVTHTQVQAAQANAASMLPAGNGTNNFYLGPENCWAGNKANVQTTNWDEGSWQSYHVWVYRPSWYTGSIYMYMDGSLKHSGAGEFYINVPDHKSHKISLKAGTSSCYYYQ